jgi:hypothetical protein
MAMGQYRNVGHHFMIHKLIALGDLHHAIQQPKSSFSKMM